MSEEGGIDRRRLVRILIVLGIGIPLLIEGVTFFGLVSHSVGNGGGTPTPTAVPGAVGQGDEVLADTPQEEVVTTASLGETAEGWVFVLTVRVENAGDAPYELRLGAVETTGGTTVEGAVTTGRLDPGETGTVTGSWTLPREERPRTVAVTTLTDTQTGTVRENATIAIERLPTP